MSVKSKSYKPGISIAKKGRDPKNEGILMKKKGINQTQPKGFECRCLFAPPAYSLCIYSTINLVGIGNSSYDHLLEI